MAALDTFEAFNASLSEEDRQTIREILKSRWTELLAARSEDARLRVVEVYVEEVRKILGALR